MTWTSLIANYTSYLHSNLTSINYLDYKYQYDLKTVSNEQHLKTLQRVMILKQSAGAEALNNLCDGNQNIFLCIFNHITLLEQDLYCQEFEWQLKHA